MSYRSRISRQRNVLAREEAPQKRSFFSNSHERPRDVQSSSFFQKKREGNNAIQKLATPTEEEKQSTNDRRMEQDKDRNIHRTRDASEAEKDLRHDDLASKTTTSR